MAEAMIFEVIFISVFFGVVVGALLWMAFRRSNRVLNLDDPFVVGYEAGQPIILVQQDDKEVKATYVALTTGGNRHRVQLIGGPDGQTITVPTDAIRPAA